MDIPEAEYRLKYPCGMSIHFLYSIETALSHCSRECWNLLDPYDARIRDDDDIEFVIYPVEEDKSEKYDPINTETTPVESVELEYIDDSSLISKKYPWAQKEEDKIKKMKYENNPMSMKCKDDLLVIF